MRCGPQSQGRDLLAQKAALARRLLAQGLTIRQISLQLRCSPTFVRKLQRAMDQEPGAQQRPGESQES
jgi:DNA invertase Pin-like site-specific DNA recombinase